VHLDIPDHTTVTQREDYSNVDLYLPWDNFLNIRRSLPSYPPLTLNDSAFSDCNTTILQIKFCNFIDCGDRFLTALTSGAAAYISNVPTVTVVNTTIRDCFADGCGGAFYFATAPTAALFESSVFRDCTAFNSSGGVIVAAAGGNLTVHFCTFEIAAERTWRALRSCSSEWRPNGRVVVFQCRRCVGGGFDLH
jgi:hypothetical protein